MLLIVISINDFKHFALAKCLECEAAYCRRQCAFAPQRPIGRLRSAVALLKGQIEPFDLSISEDVFACRDPEPRSHAFCCAKDAAADRLEDLLFIQFVSN